MRKSRLTKYITIPYTSLELRTLDFGVLLFLSLFTIVLMGREVSSGYIDSNASLLSQAYVSRISERLTTFKNPFIMPPESWYSGYSLSGPLQPIPHFLLAIVHLLSFKLISVTLLHHLAILGLWVSYPWILYFWLGRIWFDDDLCLMASVFSFVCCSSIGLGHEFQAYSVSGAGHFTQLVAMVIFPIAFITSINYLYGYKSKITGFLVSWSILLLASLLSAYLLGFILILSTLSGILGNRRKVFKRMALATILVILTNCFFIIIFVQGAAYQTVNIFEVAAIRDGYGLFRTLDMLFKGELFDAGRLPILTILLIIGFFISWKSTNREMLFAFGFFFSFLVIMGKTSWKPLTALFPYSSHLDCGRVLPIAHFFGVVLAALGFRWLLSFVRNQPSTTSVRIGYSVLILAVLWPIAGTIQEMRENAAHIKQLKLDFRKDRHLFRDLFTALSQQNVNLVYAGQSRGWGKDFKCGGVPVANLALANGFPIIGHHQFDRAPGHNLGCFINERRADHLALYNISHILSWRDDNYWGREPVFSSGHYAIYKTGIHSDFAVITTSSTLYGNRENYQYPILRWLRSILPSKGLSLEMRLERKGQPNFYQSSIKMIDHLHYKLHPQPAKQYAYAELERAIYQSNTMLECLDMGEVNGTVLSEGTLTATVKMDRKGAVMLKKPFHPYWRATVDWHSAPAIMVAPGFVATNVPPGKVNVAFSFQMPKWQWLLLILVVGIPLAVWRIEQKRPLLENNGVEYVASGYRSLVIALVIAGVLLVIAFIGKGNDYALHELPSVGEVIKLYESDATSGKVAINGVPFDGGLVKTLESGTPWMKQYRLNGSYSRFEAFVGFTDKSLYCQGDFQAEFEIVVDSRSVAREIVTKAESGPKYVHANLTGAKLLMLIVKPGEMTDCPEVTWAIGKLYK